MINCGRIGSMEKPNLSQTNIVELTFGTILMVQKYCMNIPNMDCIQNSRTILAEQARYEKEYKTMELYFS
jgi:hypothetical protein